MAGKPDFSVRCKSKASGNSVYIMAFWRGEKGIGGAFDREVDRIILKNGQVIRPDSVYLDLFPARDEHDQQQPKGTDEHIQAPPQSDVPF